MRLLAAFGPLLLLTHQAAADYVTTPYRGGGQVNAGMKHIDISFDGAAVALHVDPTVETPTLRALEPPASFDPDGQWAMLNGAQHNSQYGWNRGVIGALPPVGAWFWIEQLDASPGLRAYDEQTLGPIFGAGGASLRWLWSGFMTHNFYAIDNPATESLFAAYRVYIGDEQTGEPLPGYAAADVTLAFLATPALPGDYNADGVVDAADHGAWAAAFGQSGEGLAADGNADGQVDAADYTVWRDNLPAASPLAAGAAPEPVGLALLLAGAPLLACRRA